MPSLFLSYSRKDASLVDQLEAALRAHGHTVWRDVESIRGGANWPKAMGEAIAAHDFVVLAWSQHTATSHFVEFEWSTAVALRKTIVPCLLDDTPLPPSLAAKNGIPFQDFGRGLSALLQAVQQPAPAHEPVQQAGVLAQLQTIKATEPEQVLAEMRTWLTQHASNVQGPVYQAGRDVHVTIAAPTEEPKKKLLEKWQTWVVFLSALVVLLGALTELPKKFLETLHAVRESVAPECQFTGRVWDSRGQPVAGVEVIVHGEKGAGTTNVNGEFSFAVKNKCNEPVQVSLKKDGVLQDLGSQTLPGPVDLTFKGQP
jgi:hypothetical protein